MKKVINILVKRKSEIDKEFQQIPKEVDQYIVEMVSELQEEERQINQALLVLSNVVRRSEQFYCTCSRAKGLDHDEEGTPYCISCQKEVQ